MAIGPHRPTDPRPHSHVSSNAGGLRLNAAAIWILLNTALLAGCSGDAAAGRLGGRPVLRFTGNIRPVKGLWMFHGKCPALAAG